jgi:predicted AlkP superfamily pyrophosphatase or phosphodiesterase
VRARERGTSRISPRAGLLAAALAVLAGGCTVRETVPSVVPSPDASQRVNHPVQRGKPYVVLVSIDGYRHDYPERYPTPAISRLMREGARARTLVPVFTTKTFPNHYSLVTGQTAEHHGVVGNAMYDPSLDAWFAAADSIASRDPRWWGGEPIWVTAERQGMVTGSYFWPGSEVPVQGVLPTYRHRYDVGVPSEQRVDGVLGWLRLPPERRPHLTSLYFSLVDDAAHNFGPDSRETAAAIQKVDSALVRLMDGIAALPIRDSVNVVLVSDHGLTRTLPENRQYLDDYASLDSLVVITAGTYAQLWFRGDTARLERTRAALLRMPNAVVWRREEIPERMHVKGSPRAGDLFVLMTPPYQVEGSRARARAFPPGTVWGAHGYDAAVPEMHGVFAAWGPAFRRGLAGPPVRNLDVYPLIAAVLGLRPSPAIDGALDSISHVLRSPPPRTRAWTPPHQPYTPPPSRPATSVRGPGG